MTTIAATQTTQTVDADKADEAPVAASFLVRATAVVVALAFSTGMALAFELAMDAPLFG